MKTLTNNVVLGGILILALSLFISCSSQKANTDLDNTPSMGTNYDSLIKRLEKDLLYDLSCESDNDQGLCCLSVWNLDSNDESQILNNDLYNAFSFSHSIWADYEIWARTQLSGLDEQLVPTDSIIFAIGNISAMKLGLKHQHEAEKFQKEMVWFINNDPSKWSEGRFPGRAYNKFNDFIVDNIEIHLDTSEIYNYYRSVVALIFQYDSFQEEIETIQDDSAMFDAIHQKIEEAKSFDEQCAIALACSMKCSTFCGAYSIDLMSSLLKSGKYSVLLEQMWILWRAFSQSVLIGRSRDSVIPNYSYDKMRKRIYTTISKHVKENPQDTNAIICGLRILKHPGLIRNGENMYGNDADVDIMNYCPDFYSFTKEDEK